MGVGYVFGIWVPLSFVHNAAGMCVSGRVSHAYFIGGDVCAGNGWFSSADNIGRRDLE